MPIPEFRPLLFLIYLAVIARWNRIRPKHHLTFIVSGPHLRWKSWIAEAMCRILGLDPETLVFYLGHESGRALLGRKNSKGEAAPVLDALKGSDRGLRRHQPLAARGEGADRAVHVRQDLARVVMSRLRVEFTLL